MNLLQIEIFTIFRIFWGLLIAGLGILGLIMISKTREKIPDSQIITYDDNFKNDSNVRC